jgi:hypothetical protein
MKQGAPPFYRKNSSGVEEQGDTSMDSGWPPPHALLTTRARQGSSPAKPRRHTAGARAALSSTCRAAVRGDADAPRAGAGTC